jgi:hypothetical protein
MAPAATRTRPARKTSAKKRKSKPAVAVGTKECRSLAEDVAFFRAARFRNVEPGKCRAQDRCVAEAEIRAALKKLCKCSP